MRITDLRDFNGNINGVIFDDQILYYVVKEFLTEFENKFGEIYNDDFVSDLAFYIHENYKWGTSEIFKAQEIILQDLKKANYFFELVFTFKGAEDMNRNLDWYNYYSNFSILEKDKENKRLNNKTTTL